MATATARVRVRAAQDINGSRTEVKAACAIVGNLLKPGQAHSGDLNDVERVVWIQGGPEQTTVITETDSSGDYGWVDIDLGSVRQVPSSLSDDVALISNDMAAALHIAKLIISPAPKTVALCTPSASTVIAQLLVRYLVATRDVTRYCPDIHVVVFGSEDADAASSWKAFSSATLHRAADVRDSLFFEGCIDLSCTETSLSFATRRLRPLGTLVLLPATVTSQNEPIPVDVNAVVVNELSISIVGNFKCNLTDAVEFLAQCSSSLPHVSIT